MATSPIFVGTQKSKTATIDSNHSTRPVVVMAAGSSGARIHQQIACSSDASANTIKVYHCEKLTAQDAMGTGAFVDGGAGSDTITRSSGSFITDGWKVGDLLIVSGSTTRANDFAVRLTGVASGTLTFVTGTVTTAENLPTGAMLYRGGQFQLSTLAANAGNVAGTTSFDLLSSTYAPEVDDTPYRYRTLGAYNAIAVALGTALGAGEYLDVTTAYADY